MLGIPRWKLTLNPHPLKPAKGAAPARKADPHPSQTAGVRADSVARIVSRGEWRSPFSAFFPQAFRHPSRQDFPRFFFCAGIFFFDTPALFDLDAGCGLGGPASPS